MYFIGNAIIGFSFADQVVGEVEIVLIHTIFNVFTTLVLLPFTKVLEKLAYLTIPLGEDEQHVKGDTFAVLDERFLNSPAFAIEQCRTLISQMAEMTRDSFLEAMEVLEVYAQDKADDVIKKENMVDAYTDKVGADHEAKRRILICQRQS